MPSFLRVESIIRNNKSLYKFPISNTKKPDVDPASESGRFQRQLDRNNEFYITKMGIFIYQADVVNKPISILQTYPSSGHFAGGTNFDYLDLERLYSAGSVYVAVDNRVYIDNSLPISKFRYAPETQQDAATNVNQTAPNRGFINPLIDMTFQGNKQIDVQIACDTFPGIQWEQDAANTEVRIVTFFEGLEVVGVTS